jgi:serine phosphatase RsbU (regulator of sigma subunit)
METIRLQPLSQTAVIRLLADTFATTEAAVAELGNLILEKTGGNPFFGDVSGHGLNAGLGMLMLQSGLSALGRSGAWGDPATVLSLLNRTIYDNLRCHLR